MRGPSAPSDEQVVKRAFTAHLAGNPKLNFNDKWKSVTVSKGKRSHKQWKSAVYSIKKLGTNEYLLRHERSYYDPNLKNMKWLKTEMHYYHITVSVESNGKRKYNVKKYKSFFSGHLRTFSFITNTKAGRVPIPTPHKITASGSHASAVKVLKIKNSRCSITAVDQTSLLLSGNIIHSRDYRAAARTNKGVYYIKATFDASVRTYFITHSKKSGGRWTRHHRQNPASSFIRKIFNYACRNYIRTDMRK